jgi:hypothetical protein
MVDTVRSRLKLDRNRGHRTASFRAALSIALQTRVIEKVCRGREHLRAQYEELRDDRAKTMAAIADFLSLRDAVWRDYEFPRNTSFSNERERGRMVGTLGLASIRLAELLVLLIPLPWLLRLRKRLTRESEGVLPGTFRHIESTGQPDLSRP